MRIQFIEFWGRLKSFALYSFPTHLETHEFTHNAYEKKRFLHENIQGWTLFSLQVKCYSSCIVNNSFRITYWVKSFRFPLMPIQ